jgi:hypothetical protein
VKEWPTRISIQSSQSMAGLRQAFCQAMASPHGGNERLVEIQRVPEEGETLKKE